MDRFFIITDIIAKRYVSLKKHASFSANTTKIKVLELINLKEELKVLVTDKRFDSETRKILTIRYGLLREQINECIKLLTGKTLNTTVDSSTEEEDEKEEEEAEEEVLDKLAQEFLNASDSDLSDGEELKMPPKLDLNIALKVVKPFDGSAINLQSYIESIELLSDYAEEVPQDEIIKFLKITLTGTARGAFDGITTVDAAVAALQTRFSVKLTPKAVENEMASKRQSNKSITEYGQELEKLSAKLAAAHVSQGTFATEAAAGKIVDMVAVRSFVEGLQNPTTQFLLRARNPTTLNKAISDALECSQDASKSSSDTALWCSYGHQNRQQNRNNSWRGRGNNRGRGYYNNRGNSSTNRGRGNSHGSRGRGNYNQYDRQNHTRNNDNRNNNNRQHSVNAAEQQQQQQQQNSQNQNRNTDEEANLVELFR